MKDNNSNPKIDRVARSILSSFLDVKKNLHDVVGNKLIKRQTISAKAHIVNPNKNDKEYSDQRTVQKKY